MNYGWRRGTFYAKRSGDLRVPNFILDCAAFLVSIAHLSDQDIEYDFAGTGFFVALFSLDRKNVFRYFVTTAHSLVNTSMIRYGVRANRKDGGVGIVPIERWFTHPEDRLADVAVTPWDFNPHLDVSMVRESEFRTKELMNKYVIGIGDEVYFPGLFTLAQEESLARNQPILRMGNIAMLPDVKVPSEIGDIEAYLVEARSTGGISGSPVFSRRTASIVWNAGMPGESSPNVLHGLTGETHLIGMMHGHWEIKPSQVNQVNVEPLSRTKLAEGINLGIALVIPMYKIIETLNHPTLALMREEQEEVWKQQSTPATND